jgi:hypothetical protein
LAFVIDTYSRAIVGSQFAAHVRTDRTSFDYSQTLDDQGVLASIGTVGDAFDNAAAESFVDGFKTELMRDRVWRTAPSLSSPSSSASPGSTTSASTPLSAASRRRGTNEMHAKR